MGRITLAVIVSNRLLTAQVPQSKAHKLYILKVICNLGQELNRKAVKMNPFKDDSRKSHCMNSMQNRTKMRKVTAVTAH